MSQSELIAKAEEEADDLRRMCTLPGGWTTSGQKNIMRRSAGFIERLASALSDSLWAEPTVNGDVTWIPWTDGHAIGFEVSFKDQKKWVLLNPSGGGCPDVFVYSEDEDPNGPDREMYSPECFIQPFDEARGDGF